MKDIVQLNEEFHIPDPENVEVLIKNVFKEAENYLLEDIKSNNYDLSRVKPFDIKLEGKENPCRWLGDDTYYFINFDFKNKFQKPIGLFSNISVLNAGNHFISADETVKEGMVMHGARFIISFSLCIDKDSSMRDPFENNRDKLYSALRHEIGHAYKELFIQVDFKMQKDDDVESANAIDENRQNVYEILNNLVIESTKKNIDPSLKILLDAIYLSNYIERDAHVSGFYQRLVYDIENRGGVGSWIDYYEVNAYTLALEKMKTYDDFETFKQVRDEYVVPLFGKGASRMNVFLQRSKNAMRKTLSNMESIYDVMSKEGSLKHSYKKLEETERKREESILNDTVGINENMEYGEELKHSFITMHYVPNECELIDQKIRFYFNN